MEPTNDQSKWDALRQGDQNALRLIYESEVDFLLRYGSKFTRNAQLVEDALHDLFVNLWQNRTGLNSTTSIRKYLLVAFRRKLIRMMEKEMKRYGDLGERDLPFMAELAIDERIINDERKRETVKQLKKGLEQLTTRQKEALYLKYELQMDYQEICETMDISYQSARNLVSGAVRKLRDLMVSILLIIFCLFI